MTEYIPPRLYFSSHIETIFPALFRRVPGINYERERMETDDGDFIDLDWVHAGNRNELIIISHGLEGDSHRPYVKGMVRAFSQRGYDVLAWNFRGCSGEMNRLPRFYHSGATDDLERVVSHAIRLGYERLSLVGFSLGGNLTLKYLGEAERPAQVKEAVTFSVPVDLEASCRQISTPENWMYARRFLVNLKEKIRRKEREMPGTFDLQPLETIKNLMQFDDAYTSVLHGFSNALEYYQKCSSKPLLKNIDRPVLLINALNDPFLPEQCYPEDIGDHPHLAFLTPQKGGHVGFTTLSDDRHYWSEKIAVEFVENLRKHSINIFLHS